MNIFFLSFNPKEAARLHCDKHVVKMIIETAQLLYSAHWLLDPTNLPDFAYKLAHRNHPCSIWVRKSLENYLWLCSLGLWLCDEYRYRYGDHKIHKTEFHIRWLFEHAPNSIPSRGFTTPFQAMPDEFKNADAITAYRTYYIESKMKQRAIVNYTRREWPEFLINSKSNGGHIQVPDKRNS
jgi:hypothetical protein